MTSLTKFLRIVTEDALTTEERKRLPDEAFGIPSLRKYPLMIYSGKTLVYDEVHIRKAIQFFGSCEQRYQKQLATNIIKGMRALKLDIKISEKTDFYKYYQNSK